MTDTGATPRPWEMSQKPYVSLATGEGDNFSSGDWGIYPPLGEAGPVAVVNSEANAELIVRAVNSHDQLVAALDGLLSRLGPDGYIPVAGKPATDFARAALAAAKGES